MKPNSLTVALCLAVMSPAASAQQGAPSVPGTTAPAPAAGPKAEEDPTIGQLLKLPQEQQDKVKKLVSEASTLVGGIRLQEALQKLTEAEVLAPDLFMIHNLKGAVLTKARMFDEARKAFQKAQQLHPKSFHPKFNLAEIEFVQAAYKARNGKEEEAKAQFATAQKQFEALLAGSVDVPTQKLIEFKVVVCQLKQGNTAEAEETVKGFSYIDDEPVYYVGHAALEFHKDDKAAAQEWIDSANRIYTPAQVTIYMDSFIEVGWVETLAL